MVEHEHGHEEEVVPGEDEQARRFNQAVMIERGRQAAKGYDASHDDQHGLDHLLMWSQRYAARGEHVKAQALVQAAREYLTRNTPKPKHRALCLIGGCVMRSGVCMNCGATEPADSEHPQTHEHDRG